MKLCFLIASLVLMASVGCTGQSAAPGTSGGEKVITTSSGLKYVDLVEGTGPSPKPNQIVVVHYTGWLKDGTKFDSSRDRNQTFEFPVGAGRVIKGWDEGVMTMKVGGKRKLIIPPDLGYGPRGAGRGIPFSPAPWVDFPAAS